MLMILTALQLTRQNAYSTAFTNNIDNNAEYTDYLIINITLLLFEVVKVRVRVEE